MLLLIAVAVLSAIFGELRDAIAIFVVIVIIGAVEAIAEVRAKRALRALRDLSAPNALVRRAGVVEAVPLGGARDRRRAARRGGHRRRRRRARRGGRRPGGGRVPAHRRAVRRPRRGPSRSPPARRSPSAPRCCTPGPPSWPAPARASSSRSATDTEIGRLGRLVAQAKEPPTPLQRAMAELARYALIVAVTACVLVPLLGVLRGQPRARHAAQRADARVRHDPRGAADPRDGARGARRPAPGASTASCCGACAPRRPSAR